MSAPDQKSRRAARKFAARDGIRYVAARRMLIELGHWGRGSRYYDELLADMDAHKQTLADLVERRRINECKGDGA
jgi:hypothetical protein